MDSDGNGIGDVPGKNIVMFISAHFHVTFFPKV